MHMHQTTTLRWPVALGLLLIVTAASASDQSNMKSTVMKWESTYNAGDLEAIAAMYTEDGCRMPPNAETVTGRAAILKQLKDTQPAAPKVKLGLTHAETNDNLGYARGTYELQTLDGKQIDRGKWMNVSMNVGDNNWLIICDIYNSDNPLPTE